MATKKTTKASADTAKTTGEKTVPEKTVKTAPVKDIAEKKVSVESKAAKTKTAKSTEEPAKKTAKSVTEEKAPAKKSAKPAAAKKPAAKKDVKVKTVVEYYGKQVEEKDIIANVKKAWTRSGKKVGDIKSMELYIKPEEAAVYYVINSTETGAVAF